MIGMYPRKHKIQNTSQNSYDVQSEGDPRVHLYDRNVLSEKQQIKPEESNQRVDPFCLCRECHDSIKDKESHYVPLFQDLVRKNENNKRH